jgi:predicted anti-sigma-YlaC factor YlaD
MKACLKQEILLALMDRELRPAERTAAAEHLENCAACRARFEGIRAADLEVSELMDAMCPAEVLEAVPVAAFDVLPERESASVGWTWVPSAAAIAACALIGLAIYKHSTRAIVAPASTSTASREVAAVVPEPSSVVPKPVAHRPPKKIVKSGAAAWPTTMEFIPLDDGAPVVSGTIVRINLGDPRAKGLKQGAVSKGIPADVLLDEQGEVRAIRFLNGAQ